MPPPPLPDLIPFPDPATNPPYGAVPGLPGWADFAPMVGDVALPRQVLLVTQQGKKRTEDGRRVADEIDLVGITHANERAVNVDRPFWSGLVNTLGVRLRDPVFSNSLGGLRDPKNTRRDVRAALDRAGFDWVTSHSFRKTTATMLDEAGLSARVIADQLGHARPSMTQDVYMGRKAVDARVADALEDALGKTSPDEASARKGE